MVKDVVQRRVFVKRWVDSEDLIEWVEPNGGVVCLMRMTKVPPRGTEEFYNRLLNEQNVYVGPGKWFEMADIYFRVGYVSPSWESLEKGLIGISKAL